MSTGIDLLHVLKNKDNYLKYRRYIKSSALDEHVESVLNSMDRFFDGHPTVTTIVWSEFATWYTHVYNPKLSSDEAKVYGLLFSNLDSYTATPVTENIIDYFIKMDAIANAVDILMKIADGDTKATVIDAKDILDGYVSRSSVSEDEYEYSGHGLDALLEATVRSGGFEWALEDLNISVGPLHTGDLVTIFARPETGKTSFICNEIVHMIQQSVSAGRDAIIFNNEEAERKIRLRLYTTALGMSVTDLNKDVTKSEAAYAKKLGRLDRVRIVGRAGLSVRDIEYYVKKYKPAIIAINVLHKLRGFDKTKNDVERLGKLYSWARELAKEHDCLVILVAQADVSAEGQEWLYQHQTYGTKTEGQGEADVMIGIGKVHDAKLQDTRYLHVCKNKQPPGPRTDPAQKHGYHEVSFDNDTGRFKSKVY